MRSSSALGAGALRSVGSDLAISCLQVVVIAEIPSRPLPTTASRRWQVPYSYVLHRRADSLKGRGRAPACGQKGRIVIRARGSAPARRRRTPMAEKSLPGKPVNELANALPFVGSADGILDGRLAALRPLPRRDAPARRPVSRARRARHAARPALRGRPRLRRPAPRAPGQLPSRPDPSARGRPDRSAQAALRDRRPARRPRARASAASRPTARSAWR